MTAAAKFVDAVKQFEEFLKKEGNGSPILWVSPEDVVATGRRLLYVKTPVPENHVAKVAAVYNQAVAQGLGVRLSTLCHLPDATCCYVWGSYEDHQKEPQAWPVHGLMMSVKQDKIPGKPVKSGLRWAWLNWRYRKEKGTRTLIFG